MVAKFEITYTASLDTGDLPADALAEYLSKLADTPEYNVWEIMGDSLTLTEVKVVE